MDDVGGNHDRDGKSNNDNDEDDDDDDKTDVVLRGTASTGS